MQIRDTFATKIQERIEPVVKVAERNPAVLLNELTNLVVTPQWDKYLHRILDAYTDAAEREDESGIGIWISGFFGSGKSLLMKTLGAVLEGGELQGQSVHATFLDRLPASSPDKADLARFLKICERKITTTAVGGNLHAEQASSADPLALIAFKLFARQQGYTHYWPLAWAVEHQIAARGRSDEFRKRAGELAGMPWDEVQVDPEFYSEQLYQAAADVLPDHFSGVAAVDRAVANAVQGGITPNTLVDRLRRWCEAHDSDGRRHKLLLQLDELGQWIAGGNANERTMQVQALAETAATAGQGRIWLAVTAHGDVQALQQNVQQEYYAKINQRFAIQCKLSNDDISKVVEQRLLRKTQPAHSELRELFDARSGELTDLGAVANAQRVYPPPSSERFPLFYPYLPWSVAVIPDVVKGIAQAAGREEALTGSNRTMIGVVQGAIIDTPGLLDSPVGRLLGLADLYEQLASDVPIETKTDLNQVRDSVPAATPLTTRVARGLFLLGQAKHIPPTLDNIARALVDTLDASLAAGRKAIKVELDRLVAAGYAKQVGEEYFFLSTQQRTFQDRVRARQDELLGQTYELSQALKEFESEDALRFDKIPLQGREMALRLEIDGKVARNPAAPVLLRVYSPLQRTLEPDIVDDTVLKSRSNQESDAILFRLADVPELRRMLALAVATAEIANHVLSAGSAGGPEIDVARTARQVDLASHRAEVRKLLGQAVRGGMIFFRGTSYTLGAGDSPSGAVRATLAQILPTIYPRFADVAHRVGNEEAAVKAALAGNTANLDLQALHVYKADGSLNDANPLLSELRSRLPLSEAGQAPVPVDTLRAALERPPFGWDPNAVKVGLALLLRASACVVIDNSRRLTDPGNPDVQAALTKEQRFKNLRVEGVKTDLTMAELQQIRGCIQSMFGTKPSLVAATLNTELGTQLAETARQAQEVQKWAGTAQCPLPFDFESGTSVIGDLLNTGAAPLRLRRFLEQAGALVSYTELLHTLRAFQHEQGALFLQVRDFFNSMVNTGTDLAEVKRFINDWRTLTNKRSVTETERWDELIAAYHAAQHALTAQVASWIADARARLAEIDAGLETRVREAGVPADKVAEETANVAALFADVRPRLAGDHFDYGRVVGVRSALTAAEMGLKPKLAEIRNRYKVAPSVTETHLRWQDIAHPDRITSAEDLDSLLTSLRRRIEAELNQQRTVIIE
jgi:hypothetical protein